MKGRPDMIKYLKVRININNNHMFIKGMFTKPKFTKKDDCNKMLKYLFKMFFKKGH